MSLRIGLNGAGGRMGRLLAQAILRADDLTLSLSTDVEDHPKAGLDIGLLARQEACGIPLEGLALGQDESTDAYLDFSLPQGTAQLLEVVGSQPLVIGTTGLSADTLARLEEHALRAPVVLAPNFSTGVALLTELVKTASRVLASYDLEIVETHHRAKQDAPSGTALSLAQAAAQAREDSLERQGIYGRQGHTGPRPRGQIGLHAVRGGDLIGEHEVLLAGPGERLKLSHMATSRQAFVGGALRALRWVVDQPPGLYDMARVLGL